MRLFLYYLHTWLVFVERRIATETTVSGALYYVGSSEECLTLSDLDFEFCIEICM